MTAQLVGRDTELAAAAELLDSVDAGPCVLLLEGEAGIGKTTVWRALVASAVERGFHTFDFGRSTPDEGTYHFKKQWGAEPRELVWEYWMADGAPVPQLNPKNPKFELAIRAWQHLPVPLPSPWQRP